TLSAQTLDAVLLDLSLPDSHGLRTVQAILDAAPDLPVIILTGADDEQLGLESVALGAQDYLVKGTISNITLRRAIQFAIQRLERELSRGFYDASELDQSVVDRISQLTARELETFELLVRGISLKQLAWHLEISVQTAAKHRSRVLQKMCVENDVELVRLVLGH
ncbi:MAG: response regulator transcription factor, partial [Planctomycetaceae bacterium]